MLSDRRQKVLAALIEEYVHNATPVGSRTLTERYQLGVSPATVRNELSALEDEGYISQPHTSSGRIPTDFGYRAFVDDLIEQGLVFQPGFEHLADEMRADATELDRLMERTSSTLARLTDCLSIVMAPEVRELRVKQVTLISLSETRLLMVIVTEDGTVLNRQYEVSTMVSPDDASFLQALLNQALVGKTATDASDGLAASIAQAFRTPLAGLLLDEAITCLRQEARHGKGTHGHAIGLSGLMAQPEFSMSQALLPLMGVIEDDEALLRLLDESSYDEDVPSVFIGRENKAEGLQGVSVVASKYGRGDCAGIVAVIGPTRMNYSKVIQAVRAASRALRES